MEWSESGRTLASGSDDLKLIFWDPFRRKIINSIDTKHRGNIFSVKYFPGSNETLVASAAADRDIYVYDVNKRACIHEIHAHVGRVKRLETCKDTPSLVWSCGEDGYVLQHDIRCDPSKVTTLLVNYAGSRLKSSQYLESKCIAINPVRSELLAVGANDPYARVYDRRMMRTRHIVSRNAQRADRAANESADTQKLLFECQYDESVPDLSSLISYFVPGHLPSKIAEYRKRMKSLTCTFVTFSPNGQELLVNLGGEQLYLFNLNIANGSIYKPANSIRFDSFRKLFKLNSNRMAFKSSSSLSKSASLSSNSLASSSENSGAHTPNTSEFPSVYVPSFFEPKKSSLVDSNNNNGGGSSGSSNETFNEQNKASKKQEKYEKIVILPTKFVENLL